MFIRFLKKMVIVLALVFAAQGCAFYVGDDDGFHHFHHFHHGYRGHGYYSPQHTHVAENGISKQKTNVDEERK